jgi:carboxynorspermidine decarboxylase
MLQRSRPPSVTGLDTWDVSSLTTPAFVYDEKSIRETLTFVKSLANEVGCNLLFSLKSFTVVEALTMMAPMLDGFASSSLFEAALARSIVKKTGTVHITTPSLRADEIDNLAEICDYVSFNSLPQWGRLRKIVGDRARCGLRVNPQLSFVNDDRYNPCRKHSKLGVPLTSLRDAMTNGFEKLGRVSGIHFHTNCESTTLDPLLATVQYLDLNLADLLTRLEWINLGGGYQYDEIDSLEPLYRAVNLLRQKYELDVFIEPGEAIVGGSGYIVSSVVDLFCSDGKTLAILDTSVNHMPQIYEYQYRPDVSNSTPSGKYSYILAGATCLAGDIFGEYDFDTPLEIGSKLIFEFMGAYTLVKAHMFNGLSLPSIYAKNDKNELLLKKQYSYKDFISRWEEIPAYETV